MIAARGSTLQCYQVRAGPLLSQRPLAENPCIAHRFSTAGDKHWYAWQAVEAFKRSLPREACSHERRLSIAILRHGPA